MDEGVEEMSCALQKMLLTGAYSDLTIHCGEKSWAVHKVLLCSRSDYFKAACRPDAFKEGHDACINLVATTDEGHEDDLSADNPEAVELMIDLIYRHNYTAPHIHISVASANGGGGHSNNRAVPWLTPSGDCNVVMHAKMYALGSKYGIKSLQDVAKIKFSEAACYAWNDRRFVDAIQVVYTTTPDEDKGLRDITTRTIHEHCAQLVRKPRVAVCMHSINGLAFDLLVRQTTPEVVRLPPLCSGCLKESTAYCPRCNCLVKAKATDDDDEGGDGGW
ncbi:uncharacterized protein LTR77_005153 [Saxophila tyrrhenica]|uniref:BTB domain-containing protein n=1 Tax=Saxophila tyrrhenica TaxID=1690608 RepID=A0AAV9PFG7_9PEZI|nr:hypothetical protein LTR77_005153 [Saxophila tyrrhenica]